MYMNQLLFERSTGNIRPCDFARHQTSRLLRSFSAAPRFRFHGGEAAQGAADPAAVWAHQTGVNALALDRFDGKILISGGSDSAIKLWDLEHAANPSLPHTFRPVATAARADAGLAPTQAAAAGHRFGVTHISLYPFDRDAFLSCSYDQTLKLWSTSAARVSGTFALSARVYTHAASPIASHLLIACGTQHPAVRLVDLRSASAVQSLIAPGHVGGSAGATLAVAWSPIHDHVLASGSVDGAVRIWDVRRSSGLVALLDQEDHLGILRRGPQVPGGDADADADAGGARASGVGARNGASSGLSGLRDRDVRLSAHAHDGPVNGLCWTDDGNYIISAGHDCRIRVWDAASGVNTLASFRPSIRNSHLGRVPMFVSPVGLTAPHEELLFFANENEVAVMKLHDGSIVTRLRGMGPNTAVSSAQRGAERAVKNRLTSMVWRGAGGGGSSSGRTMGGNNAAGGVYTGHLDGQVRAWLPRLEGPEDESEDSVLTQEATEERTRKRKAVDNAFKGLMGKKITFA